MAKFQVTGSSNVIVGTKTHKKGSTFEASEAAVASLLKRKLVAPFAEPKPEKDTK